MFAALFNIDRAPIDRRSFEAAGLHIEVLGQAGQVAFLWSRNGSPADGEMCGVQSLEERLWIVGRLRLDGRSDSRTSDAARCLQAYARWGEQFLDHIAGDFCFALWDVERARLIAARDQLGVRSLFHATAGATILMSDSLAWLAARPEIGRELDDTWIGDFLAAGVSIDVERTVWRGIHRLPSAHVLAVTEQGPSIRRYWQLSVDEPLHYGDRRLYGERFRELTALAIADRMPPGRVGVSMSGGLDSTTLAAAAVEVAGDPARVVADCVHFERLMPDDEKFFGMMAARQLGIELRTTAIDDLAYDPDWRMRSIPTPEPMVSIVHAHPDRLLNRAMAAEAGVWLFGEGPDNALRFERRAYLAWLFGQRRWGRLAQAAWQYLGAKGMGDWAGTLRRYTTRDRSGHAEAELPSWLTSDLV